MIPRHIHILLFCYHRSFIYVDDFFFLFKQEWACIQAYLVTVHLQICKVPISWHKTKLSLHPTWLGWDWDLVSMTVSLPSAKFAKLHTLLIECRKPQLLRKTVERLVGLLQWICQLYTYFKPFLSVLYQDLSHGGLTPRWMTRVQVESFLAKVTSDESLTLGANLPPFSAGCRLLKLGQFAVTTKPQALQALRTFTAGWIWCLTCAPNESNFPTNLSSSWVLQQAISHSPLRVNLRLPSAANFPMAADAMATERSVGLGAWFQHPVSSQFFLGSALISSWEMLAQMWKHESGVAALFHSSDLSQKVWQLSHSFLEELRRLKRSDTQTFSNYSNKVHLVCQAHKNLQTPRKTYKLLPSIKFLRHGSNNITNHKNQRKSISKLFHA